MSPQPAPVLQASGLCFSYGRHSVLKDWSSVFAPGLTVILGDEGSGKTTLLNVLAGELVPSSGELVLQGVSLRKDAPRYRANVFWIDPRTDFEAGIPVQSFLQQQRSAWPQWNAALLDDLTDGFDLLPHLDKQMHMLSTGSRRKLFLACAFASGAALTLMDTPFAALDKRSIVLLEDLLTEATQHPTRAFVLADYEAPDIEGTHGPLLMQSP